MNHIINDIIKIQKAIREKTLVVFVGAGVSANSEVPTWGQLINWMAKKLNMDKNIQENEYLKIAQYYFNTNPRTFLKNVEKYLDGNWEPNVISEYLFKEFNPQYFVTTNYDDILEKTSNKLSMPCAIIAQDSPYIKYEKKLVEEIEKRIIKYNELKISEPTMRNGFTNNPVGLDDIYDVLKTIANLLNFEKLKKPDLFLKYTNHKDFKTYNYFLFAIDMKTFDYNKFKLEYLNYLTKNKKEQLRQIINDNISKKKIIKEKFINMISLDRDVNNRLRDRILNLLYDEPISE